MFFLAAWRPHGFERDCIAHFASQGRFQGMPAQQMCAAGVVCARTCGCVRAHVSQISLR